MRLSKFYYQTINCLMKSKDPHENEWRELRTLTMGELLKRKFQTQSTNSYSQFLLDMEFDRRKVNRDMWVSRWIALVALAVSILTLAFSILNKYQPKLEAKPQTQASAIQSTHLA